MPFQNCPIEIPEGWEFVRYGVPGGDDVFLNEDGEPDSSEVGCVAPWVVIRRARPKLEVGDWVRVVHPGGSVDGKRGVVREAPSNLLNSYLVHVNGIGELHYQRDNIIKQIRKIEPYTMDQCIAEIAERGSRRVVISCGAYTITRIGTNGAHIGDRFYVYDDASKLIAWPNGDAFGIVTWEDAE